MATLGLGSTAASSQSLDQIADQLDQTGSYLEKPVEPVVETAIADANAANVAFAFLDQEGGEDTANIADQLIDRLENAGSRYRSLIVLDNGGVWVESLDDDGALAADRAAAEFGRGAIAAGIGTVVQTLGGETADTVDSNASDQATDGSTEAGAATETSSGGGIPWLTILILGVITFFVLRWFSGRRRRSAALDKAMADDRAEIREQLRNNADHVIDLGERIGKADDDVRRMYEEAAQAYQDVSLGLDEADTPAEIDALDDRIDRAEWQFEVIAARLDGRTPPREPDWDAADGIPSEPAPSSAPPPSGRPAGRQPVPPLGGGTRSDGRGDDRPALGADESVIPGSRSSSQRRSGGRSRSGRRRSGGLGGMLGGLAKAGIGSLLVKLLLGGGLGALGSRRTQQRQSGGRSGGSGGFGGGIGGGVLR